MPTSNVVPPVSHTSRSRAASSCRAYVAAATGKAAALQNTLQLGLCFLASLAVSAGLTQALLTTTLIMTVTILLALIGYVMQRAASAQTVVATAQPACQDNH